MIEPGLETPAGPSLDRRPLRRKLIKGIVAYGAIATFWLVLSHITLPGMAGNAAAESSIRAAIDVAFVLVTSALLYVLAHRAILAPQPNNEATNADLRESERQFRSIAEMAPLGILIVRPTDGHLRYANAEAERMFGYVPGTFASFTASDLWARPEDQAGFIQEVSENGGIVWREFEGRQGDGATLWITAAARQIWISGASYILLVVNDQTAHREAETALRASEQRLRDAIASIPEAFALWDADDRLVLCNDRLKELHPAAAVHCSPGVRFADFVTASATGGDYWIEDSVEDVIQRRIAFHREARGDVEQRLADGRYVLLTERRTSDGGTVSLRADITERKRTEESIRLSKQMLQLVIDSIPVSVFWKDSDLNYLGCNMRTARDAGLESPKDIVGKSDFDLAFREQAEPYRRDDLQVMTTGVPKIGYEEFMPPNCTHVTSKLPLTGPDGAIIGVLGCALDITERKKTEQALVKSEHRFRDFAASASDWFWEMDANLRFTWLSELFEARAGLPPGDFIGKTRVEAAGGDAFAEMWTEHQRDLDARQPFRDFEYEVIGRGGTPVVIRGSGVPIFDASGAFAGYRGSSRNVTDEIRSRREATEARNRLTDAIESLTEGVALYDADDRFVLCNQSFRQSHAVIADLLVPGQLWQDLLRALVERQPAIIPEADRERFIAEKLKTHRQPGAVRTWSTMDGRWLENREYMSRDGGFIVVGVDATERRRSEEALRQSEALFRSVVDNLPMAFALRDTELRYKLINRAFETLYGVSEASLLGKTQREVFGDLFEGLAKNEAEDQIVVRDRQPLVKIRSRYLADDRRHDLEATRFPVVDAEDELLGIGNLIQDVTERTAAERALRDARDTLERRVEERTQELQEEITERKFAQQALQEAKDLLEQRVEERTRKLHDEIAERMRGEDEIRRGQERFRELADLLPLVIFETNAEGTVTFVNRKAYQVTGFTKQDFETGINLVEIIAVDDRDRIAERFHRVMQGHSHAPEEFTVVHKDRSSFPAIVGAVPIMRDATVIGQRGFILDITRRKRAEDELLQAQKMESLGWLAGGVAHDFNNIIGAILGFAFFISRASETGTAVSEYAARIERASNRAKELVESLLAFSRSNEPTRSRIRVASVIEEATELLRGGLPTSVSLVTDIHEPGIAILADATQMTQVLLNLGVNASDAFDDGAGTIRIRLTSVRRRRTSPATTHREENPRTRAADGPTLDRVDYVVGKISRRRSYAVIEVADNGKGIPPETLPQIFDPFFSTKMKGQGTGLGLSVVHGIVLSHEGAIVVQSTPGVGTVFRIYLPLVKAPALTALPQTTERIRKGAGRILIVDDEFDMADVMRIALTSAGYDVAMFTDPLQALEHFKTDPLAWHAVVTDQTMPNLSGIEFIRHLKSQNTSIPCVLYTGHGSLSVTEELALADGADAFLRKPVSPAELVELVGALIEDV